MNGEAKVKEKYPDAVCELSALWLSMSFARYVIVASGKKIGEGHSEADAWQDAARKI